MIYGAHPVLQAFLGTLVTWGFTALGSAMVFVFMCGISQKRARKILDGSLGFAAGVMLAASFWSLLEPAFEAAASEGYYGRHTWAPVVIGFLLGGVFVLASDKCMPCLTKGDPAAAAMAGCDHGHSDKHVATHSDNQHGAMQKTVDETAFQEIANDNHHNHSGEEDDVDVDVIKDKAPLEEGETEETLEEKISKWKSWKRIILLIVAITVHNIPEGLAVGVSFGSLATASTGKVPTTGVPTIPTLPPNTTFAANTALLKTTEKTSSSYDTTYVKSRNLALAIGIQNMPEGMAVSVPMLSAGYSPLKSFFWGQFSGMVEPVFAVIGALIAVVAKPILPYALAFGAGAMVYVVFDDLIPEAAQRGNVRIATWGGMIGFTIMMGLEAGLGLE